MMRTVAFRRQTGSALIVAIVFLLLLSTLALAGLRSSTTNVQIVGNMQARQEVTATAQMLIERTVSTSTFARNPQFVYDHEGTAEADFNGDGKMDATATLVRPPVCLRAREVPVAELDPENPDHTACFGSASIANPGILGSASPATGSLCADTDWQIDARATDDRSGATITISQGVRVRRETVGLNTICK